MARQQQHTASPDRAIGFSDAVYAIIATLMVLELQPPDHETGHLLQGLVHLWPLYLATVTSYLYVSVVWLNHKATFRRIQSMDIGLHWYNILVLFATSLIPFPTAVVADTLAKGDAIDERVAVALYALVGIASTLAWMLLFNHLTRHQYLLHENVRGKFFYGERLRALMGIALYAVAGILGHTVTPFLAMAIFLALPIFYAVTSEGLFT